MKKSDKSMDELKREQFLINALMDNLSDHIYFKDRESRFLKINKSQALTLGLTDPSEAIGRTDFDFFTFEHAKQAYDDEQKIIETGHMLSREERETHIDRPDTWVSTVKMPMFNNKGEIVGTFGISRDITKQKYAEETLKDSEERFRSVAQTANDSIITSDSKGNIIGWNRGAEKTFGYEAWEIIGQTLNQIIPEEYLEKHLSGLVRLEQGGPKQVIGKTVELNGLHKSGITFPIELSLSEWQTTEERFYTAIIRDITERKRIELENQVISSIMHGVTTTSNLDDFLKLVHLSLGKIVYAENCFVALYNIDSKLFSFPYFVDKFDQVPPATAIPRSCTAYVFRTEKPFLYSQEEFDKLEALGEVELVGSPSPSWIGIPLQTPTKVIGVLVLQHYEEENIYSVTDIRFLISVSSQIALAIERRMAEEEIKLKNEQLQIMNAEKDKFFSIIAHDLRGPLGSFVTATEMIVEQNRLFTPEEILDLTVTMKKEATSVYRLLDNLLEWSRFKRGLLEFNPVTLNVRSEVDGVIELLSVQASQKKIEIVNKIPPEFEIYADTNMLETVIRNLVSNALKFTPEGGHVIVSGLHDQMNNVQIEISDTGIGMGADLLSRLFRLNEKTNRPGTNGEPSTGLGLILCKEFIEKHGGTLRVESVVNQGSRFIFTFPVHDILK